ncbi:MAG: hypothetical protein IJS24_01575 [Eubacterium sp.]|nr:hypothetical protein [Eubacterium sp.]
MQETMRSKKSFFNKALFISDIKKQVVLSIGLLLAFILVVLIPGFLGSYDPRVIESIMWFLNPVPIAILAVIYAVISFSYMYKNTASHMLHALPVSREAHFISHYLAGLIMLIITVLACACLVVIKSDLFQGIAMGGILTAMVEVVFFYSLAVFAVMVCGNSAIALATYIVLNFLWLFINVIMSMINYFILWHPIVTHHGINDIFGLATEPGLDAMFPIIYFLRHINANSFTSTLIMLIPAVILTIISLILYKHRRIEKTGELVAFPWCAVVCRVMFTVCFAGVITGIVLFFAGTSGPGIVTGGATLYITLYLTLIIGGAIGFIISEMLLQKTIRIFSGKKVPFIQGLIPICLIGIYIGLMGCGVIGEELIPSADDTKQVVVYYDSGDAPLVISGDATKEKAIDICRDLADDEEIKKNNTNPNMYNQSHYINIEICSNSRGAVFLGIHANDEMNNRILNSLIALKDSGDTTDNIINSITG